MIIRSRAAGFTLLEAIVTLVIVSLLVTVLMQALAMSLQLRERLALFEQRTRVGALQEGWFRETIEAALADLPDREIGGNEALFRFATAAPLAAAGPSTARWVLVAIEGGDALVYEDARLGRVDVLAGPLRNARFSYLGADGTWEASWRPSEDDTERLPRAVRFEADATDGAVAWIAHVAADPAVQHRLRLQIDPEAPAEAGESTGGRPAVPPEIGVP